jgi:hypothetical protein
MNETSTTASQAGDASPSEWIAFERLLADLAAKFANGEAAPSSRRSSQRQ